MLETVAIHLNVFPQYLKESELNEDQLVPMKEKCCFSSVLHQQGSLRSRYSKINCEIFEDKLYDRMIKCFFNPVQLLFKTQE